VIFTAFYCVSLRLFSGCMLLYVVFYFAFYILYAVYDLTIRRYSSVAFEGTFTVPTESD